MDASARRLRYVLVHLVFAVQGADHLLFAVTPGMIAILQIGLGRTQLHCTLRRRQRRGHTVQSETNAKRAQGVLACAHLVRVQGATIRLLTDDTSPSCRHGRGLQTSLWPREVHEGTCTVMKARGETAIAARRRKHELSVRRGMRGFKLGWYRLVEGY